MSIAVDSDVIYMLQYPEQPLSKLYEGMHSKAL